ncbi:MAG: hypothetical protein PVJ56_14265 [Desulfobacterales bacterium]|jgi:hypothetical protein
MDKKFLDNIRIYLAEKTKELRPKLSEERNIANDEIMRNFTIEEKLLLKRLLRDIEG